MTRDDVLKKIRKLLALSENNPNEHEAIAAALKAQRLIADNDVSQFELHAGDDAQEIVDAVAGVPYKGQSWRVMLASAVADNFRCRAWCNDYHKNGRKTGREQHFYGYEQDARAAGLVYERLAEVGEDLCRRECRRARAQYGTCAGVKNTYLLGFVRGVRAELEKQSQALMIVTPLAVRDSYEEFSAGFGKVGKFQLGAVAISRYDEGLRDGGDAVRAGRLEEGGGSALLGGERAEKLLVEAGRCA